MKIIKFLAFFICLGLVAFVPDQIKKINVSNPNGWPLKIRFAPDANQLRAEVYSKKNFTLSIPESVDEISIAFDELTPDLLQACKTSMKLEEGFEYAAGYNTTIAVPPAGSTITIKRLLTHQYQGLTPVCYPSLETSK